MTDTNRTTDALREQYAVAIRALNEGGTLADLDEDDDVRRLADAVLTVRDRRMEQLRADRDRIADDLRSWAGRLSQKVQDEQKRAEQLAAVLREVLDQFADWPKGGTLWPDGGVVAKASTEDWDRWDAFVTRAVESSRGAS
ncbi:hypothetical protein [Streptomyces sp. DSM 41534]